jgi:hypothetical protein
MDHAGWSVPEQLPPGYFITRFEYRTFETESLSVSIATPSGSISLSLLHARIDPNDRGDLVERTIGGRRVYCVESDGQLAGAMNSGGELVAFVSHASLADLATVLANSPSEQPPGARARISRGWNRLLALWS